MLLIFNQAACCICCKHRFEYLDTTLKSFNLQTELQTPSSIVFLLITRLIFQFNRKKTMPQTKDLDCFNHSTSILILRNTYILSFMNILLNVILFFFYILHDYLLLFCSDSHQIVPQFLNKMPVNWPFIFMSPWSSKQQENYRV